MKAVVFTEVVHMETLHCANCGMPFAMTADFIRRRREDRARFYCPAGHGNGFSGETDLEKTRRELQRAQQKLAEKADEAKAAWEAAQRNADQRDAARKEASVAKGQVTKLRKRAAAGTCPCCNRTFSGLARHMAAKHPEFKVEEVYAGS